MKKFYALMSIFGLVLPYYVLVSWLVDHGFSMNLFFIELVETRIGVFAWTDVVLSAFVLLVFIRVEGARLKMKALWLPAVGTCVVGVSFGLPLFLCMRESNVEGSSS